MLELHGGVSNSQGPAPGWFPATADGRILRYTPAGPASKTCPHLNSTCRNLSSENNGKNKKGTEVYCRAVYDSKKLETSLMYAN